MLKGSIAGERGGFVLTEVAAVARIAVGTLAAVRGDATTVVEAWLTTSR